MYSQYIGLHVHLSRVQRGIDSQVDGVLGLSRVVVVDQGRVRGDVVAGGEPAHQHLLQEEQGHEEVDRDGSL